ncbi:MAG: alcohol dehydrogenase catalytic domain-containing protein [Streptosporangiales bacterium]|nr:alcohol dehydrogenase catalytic domain-containing protein [Streptosporangiales bacterium]
MVDTAVAAVWHGTEERFRLEELPLPRLQPGEVLVENRCATLCGSDLHTIGGERSTPLPTVLGHEMVGEVVAVGGHVETYDGTPVTPGLRVTWSIGASCGSCVRCRRGIPQKCARLRKYGHEAIDEQWQLSGGLASHCHVQPGTALVQVPDSIPDSVATPANCATATVASALRTIGVRPGSTALVQGCGMLGLTAVGYLRSLGVQTVVACDIDADRRALAERCGATTTAAPDELRTAVLDATAGEGTEYAVDLTGNDDACRAALELLAVGGRLGLVGSVFPTPGLQIAPEQLVRRLISVTGVHNYAPVDLADAVRFLDRHADHELFGSFVPDTFPLAEIEQAVTHATEKRPPRVAIDPSRQR